MNSIHDQIQHWLSVHPEIELCMLYGSFAQGTAHEKSDVDLAIMLNHPLSYDERIDYAQSLGSLLNRQIDLVDLSTAHGLILKEIISMNCFLGKKNEELFANLLKKLWFEEADFGPIRDKILEERRTRVFN